MEPDEKETGGSIQAFIDTIRKEGIERAEAEAESILAGARVEAGQILDAARQDADRRVQEAEERISRLERSFRQSMETAAATLIRAVRDEIVAICERIVEEKAAESLTPEMVGNMIEKLAGAWKPGGEEVGLEVLLNEKDLESLELALKASLRERMLSGVELKPSPDIGAGFRIGLRDGGMHYDFTAGTIAEVMSAYLIPAVAVFMQPGRETDGRSESDGSDR